MSNWLSKIAIPIDSDYLSDLHHPELKKVAPKNTQIYVYHGTSTEKLLKILQTGYMEPEVEQSLKSYENSSPGIFVALNSDKAKMYAWNASKTGGDEIVLLLKVPWKWIDFDPDDLPESGYNKDQGRIWKDNYGNIIKIPVNRIIMVGSTNYEEGNEWKWETINSFIKNLKRQGVPGTQQVLLRNLNRRKPQKDTAQFFAESIVGWVSNYIEFVNYQDSTEKIMTMIYQKLITPSMNARIALPIASKALDCELDWNQFPKEYAPNEYESIWMFLSRTGNMLSSEI